MAEFKQIPLKPREASDIQLLFGCLEIFDGCAEKLKSRLQACGQWSKFRTCQAFLHKITNEIMTTVPLEKATRFLLNLTNQEIRVVSKRSLDTRPGFVLIEEDNLRELMIFSMKSACVLCDGSHQERKSCQLRRILKQTTLFEPEESNAECLGQWLLRRCSE